MKPHGEFCQCCCDRCDWIVIVLQYAEDELLNKRSKFNISFKYYSKCSEKKVCSDPARKRGCVVRAVKRIMTIFYFL